jgi:hypothetical protein
MIKLGQIGQNMIKLGQNKDKIGTKLEENRDKIGRKYEKN